MAPTGARKSRTIRTTAARRALKGLAKSPDFAGPRATRTVTGDAMPEMQPLQNHFFEGAAIYHVAFGCPAENENEMTGQFGAI